MEFLGKSVQCIEIAEKVESVMMYNCQVTFIYHIFKSVFIKIVIFNVHHVPTKLSPHYSIMSCLYMYRLLPLLLEKSII